MSNSPIFSVIIPVYNVSKYIRETIDSILKQSFKDFELILVDDGSPDDCPQICDEYKELDKRVIVIHKSNGGLVSARKEGAKLAKGKYSVCVDGDDWIREDTLFLLSQIVELYNEPDIICFGIVKSYERKEEKVMINELQGFYSREKIVKDIFPMLIQKEDATYFPPSLCGKAIRTNLYKEQQINVSPEIIIGEDGVCTIPCLFRANSMFVMNDYLYYYRQNDSSMTKAKKSLSWNIPILNAKQIASGIKIDQYDFKEQLYRKVCHDTYYVVISSFYSGEKYNLTKQRVCEGLSSPIISEAIEKAVFKDSIKAKLMMFTLRHRFLLPYKLFSIIK